MNDTSHHGETSSAAASLASSRGTLLRWSLRLFGSVDLLATLALVMPTSWMMSAHRLCGLGELPPSPLPVYLARSTSMLYAFHGALLWRLSFDVERWRSIIAFMAWGAIVMGMLLVLIDLRTGMPAWWLLVEGPAFTASGLWLLWAMRW